MGKKCQQMAREIVRKANDEDIEKSVEYYNSKVKPVQFKVNECVLLKVQNFLSKNRKLVETFKGTNVITKIFDNGTVQIRTKYEKHDQIVNQILLVKYRKLENDHSSSELQLGRPKFRFE
jgi:hypothetical protein